MEPVERVVRCQKCGKWYLLSEEQLERAFEIINAGQNPLYRMFLPCHGNDTMFLLSYPKKEDMKEISKEKVTLV